MQRKNRSAGATLGAAFLFLSFTAIPVSLHAVGLKVHFSPSVNAVIDVWDEIAGALRAGSQPVSTAELVALNNSSQSAPAETPVAQPDRECQLASNEEGQGSGENGAVEEHLIASPAAGEQAKPARRGRAKPATRSILGGRPLEMASVRVPHGELEFRPIEVARDLETLAINREALMRDFKKRTALVGLQMRETARFARASKDFKVLVNVGKSLERVLPAATPQRPCPSGQDVAPKARKARVSQFTLPEVETGEI